MKNEPQLLPAKIIKIDIEEVPENYLRPYILQAKPKYHKVLEIVEGMIPTQEETFTREEYQLVLFGYGKKIRQPFYVKKEFQSMFEALFNEIIATALEEQRKEHQEEIELKDRTIENMMKEIRYLRGSQPERRKPRIRIKVGEDWHIPMITQAHDTPDGLFIEAELAILNGKE